MPRALPALLAIAAALPLAACGAGGSGSDSHVSTKAAKAGVESAARVQLVSQPVPDHAADQGLRASYTNAPTAAKDRQAVALFVLDDPRAAKKVEELVGDPAGGRSRLIVHDEVLVVYAPAGTDRGDQVEKAVKAL
ncbi:MAG TPA: hypothetical protein VFN44_04010 [Solirubrobacteraceae bacterium]|nr:hypothetical protein [Solirubrobacteraceae bacterium]